MGHCEAMGEKKSNAVAPNTRRDVVLSFTTKQLGNTIVILASFACVSCVLISLWKDFESSTGTNCGKRAPNYLPTFSSAAGGHTPQRYIWRLCFGLNSAPLLMIAVMTHGYYKAIRGPAMKRRQLYEMMANLSSLLNFLEIMGLIGLSFISSVENASIHQASFGVFLIASELHMLVTTILYRWSCSDRPMTPQEQTSYRRKVTLFLLNVTCFVSGVYFFIRHNNYCEPGVYTAFALLEYCCIATNICYHYTTMVLDMGDIQNKTILPFPSYIRQSDINGVKGRAWDTDHLVNGWHTKDD